MMAEATHAAVDARRPPGGRPWTPTIPEEDLGFKDDAPHRRVRYGRGLQLIGPPTPGGGTGAFGASLGGVEKQACDRTAGKAGGGTVAFPR